MKISIIIRTYNRGYIIADAIRSALNQTHRDYEIVVVDDGSTDNTQQVVNGFKDDRIHFHRHQVNRGVGAACNTGIAVATGELVAFLDSDDLWECNYLERQAAFAIKHPDIGAVFTDVKILDGVRLIPSLTGLMQRFPSLLGEPMESNEYQFEMRKMYLCLLEELPIKPTALVIRSALITKVGQFNESWRSGEDWEFLLRLAKISMFGYIHSPLVIQRRTPDATHLQWRELDKSFLLELFCKEKENLRHDREALGAVRLGIASHCNNLGCHYLRSGRRWKSITTYLRGFKHTKDVRMLFRAARAASGYK